MKILSCGAGMQSTALALMSCENKLKGNVHPLVPIYDAVIFCDLGFEPEWVLKQAKFIEKACKAVGIPYYTIPTGLYEDYLEKFGNSRVASIPFWSVSDTGKKARMRRNCTIDYKIEKINRFVRYELLGYRYREHIRKCDIAAHEMHIGFSAEEKKRAFESYNKMFVNKYPLIEMGLTRSDNYKYILEVWGLETKASACTFCPFHQNYFYKYIKEHYPKDYKAVVEFDEMLEEKQPQTKIRDRIFISKSRKRIADLSDEECNDAQTFDYEGKQIWNGF